ncbi:hypothetical protein [Mogibacterium sp.]|uniref:hypothetical protein n=1 Tax=Mogibacterium sp. TaxID=2049035 RepID=UPI0025903749|nr:hypothetical protein [Mogibacterium sp.]MCI7124473.1 hypothetical protein [Mogibacterium sp.]
MLDGEKYIYSIEYNEQYQITAGGGDSFVADHADVENYDDARKAAAALITQMLLCLYISS